MVGLLYNLRAVTIKYFSYPVTVGIDIRHASDLDFPAVTICNVSPMRASLYESYFESLSVNESFRRRRRRSTGEPFHTCMLINWARFVPSLIMVSVLVLDIEEN
jgi:hypothetical protein